MRRRREMASNFQQAYEEVLYVSITVFAILKKKKK